MISYIMDVLHSQVFIQFVGVLGLLAYLISFQIKANKKLFFMQLVGILMFMLQFVLLGALSGCFNLGIGALRNVMLMNYKKVGWIRWKGWPWLFAAAYLAATMLTWKGPVSIFPFISMTSCTFAYWTNKPRPIRLANLCVASPSWIVYDSIVGSWAGVVNELLSMGSVLLSIYRYGWKDLGKSGADYEE